MSLIVNKSIDNCTIEYTAFDSYNGDFKLLYNKNGIKVDLTCHFDYHSDATKADLLTANIIPIKALPRYQWNQNIPLNDNPETIRQLANDLFAIAKSQKDIGEELDNSLKKLRGDLAQQASNFANWATPKKTPCCIKLMNYLGNTAAKERIEHIWKGELSRSLDSLYAPLNTVINQKQTVISLSQQVAKKITEIAVTLKLDAVKLETKDTHKPETKLKEKPAETSGFFSRYFW